MVVMNDDPRPIAETVRVWKSVYAVLLQNIERTLGSNVILLVLVVFCNVPMSTCRRRWRSLPTWAQA